MSRIVLRSTLPPAPGRGRPPFFFFNDTATTEIYTLSLHDALPISSCARSASSPPRSACPAISLLACRSSWWWRCRWCRSEEHTSELQSRPHLVCRLLLEKKNRPETARAARSHAELPGRVAIDQART